MGHATATTYGYLPEVGSAAFFPREISGARKTQIRSIVFTVRVVEPSLQSGVRITILLCTVARRAGPNPAAPCVGLIEILSTAAVEGLVSSSGLGHYAAIVREAGGEPIADLDLVQVGDDHVVQQLQSGDLDSTTLEKTGSIHR